MGGDLPKFMEIDVHHENERLRAWKVAIEVRLAATRPVVAEWFDWSWAEADQHYQYWLKTHVLRRSSIRIETAVPVRYQWIENFFQPKFYDTMPNKLQAVIRQESLGGVRKRTVDMLFLLFQQQGPGTLDEIDYVLRRLRSPNPCKDPGAALAELRSWFSSMQRATELGLTLPDVQELHRGALSIYQAVFADSHDPGLQFRWQMCLQSHGQQHVQTHEGLRVLNQFAVAELKALIIGGRHGANTSLPLTDTQKVRAKAEAKKAARATTTGAAPATKAASTGSWTKDPTTTYARPTTAVVTTDKKRYSITTSPWAKPCKDWEANGICRRGITCYYRRDGIMMIDADGKVLSRCVICGEQGHTSKDCKYPGGGLDPERERHQHEYKERQQQHGGDAAKGGKGGKGKKGDWSKG